MKIEKLRIHNIASLSEAELDFTNNPLRDASLFLIDGVTGSGKTTILDAICLALYGITPRMDEANKEEVHLNSSPTETETGKDNDDNTLRTNDTKQLLRRGAVEGFVELSFIGNDNCSYLAKWEIKHSYNKLEGKLQTPKQSLLNVDTKVVYAKSELRNQIEKVVGLKFDQFCRTTLLAQGDFTRFLYSKEDEKADILEKLTGTSQYARIGRMVYTMYDEVKEQYKEQNTRLSLMSCLTDEQVVALNNQLKEQIELQGKLNKENNALSKQLSWLQSYQREVMELSRQQSELKTKQTETQKPSFKTETRMIDDYNLSESARNDVKALAETEKGLETEKGRAKGYKTRYFSLLDANKRLENNIKTRENSKGKLAEAVETASKKVREVQKNIDDKTKEIDSLKRKRDEMNQPRLTADKNLVMDKITICNRAEYAYNEVVTASQNEKDTASALKQQEELLQDMRKQLGEWQDKNTQCQKDYDIKNEIYEKVSQSVQDWAKEARKKFNIGDRCPVCGQEIHSLLHDEDFQSLLAEPEKERNEARKALDEATTNVKSLQRSIHDIERLMPQYKEKSDRAIAEKAKKEQSLAKICMGIDELEYASDNSANFIDRLTKVRNKLNERKGELDKKLEEVNLQNKQIESKNNELVTLQNSHSKAEREKNKKEREQTDNINEIKSMSKTLDSCENMKNSMKEILVKWLHSDGVSIVPISLNDLQSDWTTFITEIARWKNSLDLYQNNLEKEKQSIEEFLSTHKSISMDDLLELSKFTPAKINSLKSIHKKIEDDITSAKGAISTLKEQIDKAEKERPQMAEGVTIAELTKSIEENSARKDNVSKTIAEINVRLSKDKQDRLNKAKAEEKLKALKESYAKWKVFNDLFGSKDGKKFKMIAESFILNHLLDIANKYLEQFTDRFTLTCAPGSLVILIHDRYQGDKAFGASTLSGGESFLVSLSLALGLSQLNTSRNAVDTLFIDEGFGTLDGDYLNAVMDALGKLHQIAGRRVGIISHVEILSTLIPTQIQVKKVNPTQSRVLVTKQNA